MQGDSSTIDPGLGQLGAIHDEGEGEYEGYCCHEILLTRLQQSSDVIFLSEVQEMTECEWWSFMLFSRPTWYKSHTVRIHPHPFLPSYLTVNVYACSSPTPAFAKTWTLSMETSTGGTQISRFVKFKDAKLSFRRLISPRFHQIHPSWYIQEHEIHSNLIQVED